MKKKFLLPILSLLNCVCLILMCTTLTGCGKDDLTITLEAGDVTTAHPGDTIQLTSEVSDTEVGLPVYEIVEEDDELDYVSKIFAEILEDIDLNK